MFIAESCPALAADAYALAATTIMSSTLDTRMYAEAVDGYNNALTQSLNQGAPAVKGKQKMALDHRWIEETRRTADATTDRLEVELKNYQTNLIKESIRVREDAASHVSETRR